MNEAGGAASQNFAHSIFPCTERDQKRVENLCYALDEAPSAALLRALSDFVVAPIRVLEDLSGRFENAVEHQA